MFVKKRPVQRYWINKLLCWHGKENKTGVFMSNNGAVLYCKVCNRKVIGIHDFSPERFMQ